MFLFFLIWNAITELRPDLPWPPVLQWKVWCVWQNGPPVSNSTCRVLQRYVPVYTVRATRFHAPVLSTAPDFHHKVSYHGIVSRKFHTCRRVVPCPLFGELQPHALLTFCYKRTREITLLPCSMNEEKIIHNAQAAASLNLPWHVLIMNMEKKKKLVPTSCSTVQEKQWIQSISYFDWFSFVFCQGSTLAFQECCILSMTIVEIWPVLVAIQYNLKHPSPFSPCPQRRKPVRGTALHISDTNPDLHPNFRRPNLERRATNQVNPSFMRRNVRYRIPYCIIILAIPPSLYASHFV